MRPPDAGGAEREPDEGPEREPHPDDGAAPGPTTASAGSASAPKTTLPGRTLAGCALFALVVVAVLIGGLRLLLEHRPRLTESVADSLVTSVLQREARRAFLVTGSLDLAVTTRVRTTTRLLPGMLDLPLGTTESTVRVPGRVSYGIRVSDVQARDIAVFGDTVEIRLPDPAVYSVEPMLERMEVQTEAGWLTVRGEAREDVERRAIGLVRGAMLEQARLHLAGSEQPRINSAETLHELLRPVFQSAGVKEPVFRFRLGESLTWSADR